MIPTHIVIHHSATDQSVTFAMIREHHKSRGWDDIGYHFVIDPNGVIIEGRAENVVGAHALGLNQTSLGICCIGNFEEIDPNPAQLSALKDLLCRLTQKYHITPDKVLGHCDVTGPERENRKSLCPGKKLYSLLEHLRAEIRDPSCRQ